MQLYDGFGKPDEAAKWRKELEAQRKATEKAAKPGTRKRPISRVTCSTTGDPWLHQQMTGDRAE